MGALFGSKPEPAQAAAPLPQEDDAAARRAALRERTRQAAQPSGRLANQLSASVTTANPYKPATTRTGANDAGPALLTGIG